MDSIDNAVEWFGKSIEIEGLRFNRHNVVRLDVEGIGRLYIERLQRHVLAYMAVRHNGRIGDSLALALKLCHFRQMGDPAVSAGFKAPDWIIFAVRLERQQVTPDGIEGAVDQLHSCAKELWSL